MEQSKFFKFIWRANGVLIFLIALLTLGLITFFFILESLLPTFQNTPPPLQTNTQEVNKEADVEFGMRFERRSQFAENYVIVEQYAVYNEKGLKSYSGNRRQTRNIGIHNLTNGKTNWVFANNNQHIEDNVKIRKELTSSSGETESVIVGHFLVTATTSENDEVIRDIWVSDVDGLEIKKLISNVSKSPELIIFDSNQARILLESKGFLKAIEFDIETRTIGKTTIINPPK